MSSFLYRYYHENDLERFQRLLSGQHSTPHRKSTNVVLTRPMLRELDSNGRTVLHLACSEPGRLEFVSALLAHPLVDASVPDLESGWTALHRALYHGNISAAREIVAASPANWALCRVKDVAGEVPFEVFEATIHEAGSAGKVERREDNGEEEDEEVDTDTAVEADEGLGDEVFAWGSNMNLTLGFSDGDDRNYPERVSLQRPKQLLLEQAKRRYSNSDEKKPEELLDASVLFNSIQISDIHLSKFHTAILTTDSHSNLFICGFGRGGRLGFGDEQNMQPTFRPLGPPLLPKKRVDRVALGQDHTIVVLEGGEVWTWGNNSYGQLGYALQQKTSKEEPIQFNPRQVFGLIKREPIIGCAASRVHTAVFTATSLFTFGKNDGQLGILDSSDAHTLEMQATPRNVSANFLGDAKIIEVVAIDKATVILLESHEVWILAGHTYSRLTFPIERFVGFPAGAEYAIRYDSGLNGVRKITGGGDTLCALSQQGDVFALDVDAALKDKSAKGSGKVVWAPQQAWSLRKRHMAVRDVDVGADGNIIICTQSGSVWRRAKRTKIKDPGSDNRYKFDRVAGLTRITAVRSNITGAFAAIRRDSDLMRKRLVVDEPGLWKDVGRMLSFGRLFEADGDDEMLELVDESNFDWGYGPKPRPSGYWKARCWFMQNNVEEELKEHLRELELHEGLESWDMSVSTSKCELISIPVHSFILARSPVLRKLLVQDSEIPGVCEMVSSPHGEAKLVFYNIELLTLLNLVYYLYIDTIIDLWHQRGITKSQANHFKSLRTELATLASTLELRTLHDAVGRMHYPSRSMHKDIQAAYHDPDFFQATDMVIDVASGASIPVHSALMRVRCPFFDALYCGGAGGRWLLGRHDEGKVNVDMKHVPADIMEMVVSWLYYDWDEEEFDRCRVGVADADVDLYLDFVLDVLSTANELMLDRLAQVCQKVVGRYINTRNAAGLLTAVSPCSQRGFKDQCLQYICANLETMLENQ